MYQFVVFHSNQFDSNFRAFYLMSTCGIIERLSMFPCYKIVAPVFLHSAAVLICSNFGKQRSLLCYKPTRDIHGTYEYQIILNRLEWIRLLRGTFCWFVDEGGPGSNRVEILQPRHSKNKTFFHELHAKDGTRRLQWNFEMKWKDPSTESFSEEKHLHPASENSCKTAWSFLSSLTKIMGMNKWKKINSHHSKLPRIL